MNLIPLRNRHLPVPSPEFQLLNLSARMDVDNHAESQISALLRNSIDWKAFRELVIYHRVTPLVYRTFQKHNHHKIPEEVMADLRRQTQANSARSLYLTHELFNLIDLFESNNISVIALKGPALAQQAYGDVALRQIDDIDVLIKEEDYSKTDQLLQQREYLPIITPKKPVQLKSIRGEGERGYHSPRENFFLDLHWMLFPRIEFRQTEITGFWKEKDQIELSGRQVTVLPLHFQLVLTSVHGFNHGWSQLKWISDFVNVGRKCSITDWTKALDLVQKLDFERYLNVAILLTKKWYELENLNEIPRVSKYDATVHALVSRFVGNLQIEPTRKMSLGSIMIFHTRARKLNINKLRYLSMQIFSPGLEDLSWISLPVKLHFVYSFLRPFRLLFTYILPSLFRRMTSVVHHNETDVHVQPSVMQ